MKCNKCHGLAIYEPFFQFIGWRCMNCGKRFWAVRRNDSIEFDSFFMNRTDIVESAPRPSYASLNLFKDCLVCDKNFKCKCKRQLFCSTKCRQVSDNRSKRAPTIEIICPVCDEPFTARNKARMYCTTKCLVFASNRRKAIRERERNDF